MAHQRPQDHKLQDSPRSTKRQLHWSTTLWPQLDQNTTYCAERLAHCFKTVSQPLGTICQKIMNTARLATSNLGLGHISHQASIRK